MCYEVSHLCFKIKYSVHTIADEFVPFCLKTYWFFRRAEIYAIFSLAQKIAGEYNVSKIFILFSGWTAAFAAGRPYFVLFYRTGESLVGSLRARQIAKPTITKQVIGRRMKCQTFVTSQNPNPVQSVESLTGAPYSMSRET
jgi:hypothetical protein